LIIFISAQAPMVIDKKTLLIENEDQLAFIKPN
jgi:hypothetical protein